MVTTAGPRPTKKRDATFEAVSESAINDESRKRRKHEMPGPSTPPAARRQSATLATYRRDGHVCTLSGYGYPDSAHIFPFSAAKDPSIVQDTWTLLETFWGPEAATVWRSQCENEDVTESPKNMICLSKHLHALWGAARFGLKPLRDARAAENNEVWVQFYWLGQGRLPPNQVVDISAMDNLAQYGMDRLFVENGSDAHAHQRGRNGTLAHQASGRRIETGQVFVIKANDPELLPSLDLLELQWVLVRLAALSGAAGVYAGGSGDDDDKAFAENIYGPLWGSALGQDEDAGDTGADDLGEWEANNDDVADFALDEAQYFPSEDDMDF